MGWADQRRAAAIGKGVNASVEKMGLQLGLAAAWDPYPSAGLKEVTERSWAEPERMA